VSTRCIAPAAVTVKTAGYLLTPSCLTERVASALHLVELSLRAPAYVHLIRAAPVTPFPCPTDCTCHCCDCENWLAYRVYWKGHRSVHWAHDGYRGRCMTSACL